MRGNVNKQFMLGDEQVERVLVVTAHPDDVDFLASENVLLSRLATQAAEGGLPPGRLAEAFHVVDTM